MKTKQINRIGLRIPARFALIILFGFLCIRCQDDVKEWEPSSDQMVITEYVYSEPEQFSEFGDVLKYTGVENLLRVRGPFTLLLPTNSAMQEYYTRMNVSSYTQLGEEELEKLVYNHILEGEIAVGAMMLGKLPFNNGLGDYIACDFPGIEILLNKKATIIKRDIRASNGVVHHIDYVLEPITKSVYEVLADDPGYSIFLQGLDRSGLADTLKMISFPYGSTSARTRYTLLAVPDTLFNRMGISSIDDLMDRYSTGGSPTDINDGFYQYMEYHCISGIHYFSDFTTGPNGDIYYLVSNENYLNIRVEDDWIINKTDTSETRFYYDLSNVPAKNGTIHAINTLLPNEESSPTEVTFQVTDYFDLQQGPYYGNYYKRFYDGQNTFEFIKWDGEYLLYYLKTAHNLLDDDALNMSGHFWIEITTPKIRKGTYDLQGHFFQGSGWAVMSCYLDGEYFGVVDPNTAQWGVAPFSWGEVEFTETKQHTIKLQSIVPGGMFWDYVRFTPI